MKETEYAAYWDEVAEISYIGENQILVFRKSAGTGDNSGDYSEYKNNPDIEINTTNVQIKGNDNIFYTANWEQNGYSYSIRLENGISREHLIDILDTILK